MRVLRWPVSKFNDAAETLDRRRGWDKLPLPVAMLTLIGLRNRLREKNLYDTGRGPLDKPDVNDHPRYMTSRTLDSLTVHWWLPILPAAIIFLLCLLANLAGDGIRAALRGA